MRVVPKDLRERNELDQGPAARVASHDTDVAVLHDLQQPVAVLRLLLELLPDGSLRRRQVERLRDAALGEIAAMQRLLSAGLEARTGSRGAAPRFVRTAGPDQESTSFDAIVRAVVAPFLAAGARLTVGCEDGVVVGIPPLPLRRIVSNLVHNAVRAAGAPPGGAVMIDLRQVGSTAVVLIDDTGPGFGAIATEHGLGLLNSMAVVFSFGGSLQVGPSRLGGTRIRVSLPVAGS